MSYGVAAVVFWVIDLAWIAAVANNLYRSQIGHLLATQANVGAVVLFYVGYVAGIVHFGVQPHRPSATLGQRVGGAALFGLFSYGTWALTALAVLKEVPVLIAVTDIAWGVAVCSTVTVVTATILRRTLADQGLGRVTDQSRVDNPRRMP
ncbi:MAG: DUF2177 family protein [Propionicimonas sp.]